MRRYLAVGILALAIACGSDDKPSQLPPMDSSILNWAPPIVFADNTPLNPFADLDRYELYVAPDNNFNDDLFPIAEIAAMSDNALTTHFALSNVANLSQSYPGRCVALKAITFDGDKSDFSIPTEWR